MKKSNIILQLTIIFAILIVANLISSALYFRLDFTEDKQYTFSEATKDVVQDLEGVVTISAYFSEELPAQLMKTRQDFEDQLIEYENLSGGNIVYEFINPNESEETEQEAQQQGIGPVMINVTERDQVQQMRAYMGAVLKMDDRTEVISWIQPGAAMEYALTTAIKKISIEEKPKIGLIQGYGEPGMQAIPQLYQQLSVLYTVEPLNIANTPEISSDYRCLVWLDPKDTVNPADLDKLDQYMASGGGLFLAYSNTEVDFQQRLLSTAPDRGIKPWVRRKGISIQDNFVTDANCGAISVQQSNFPFPLQIDFPYFPITSNFAEHPIAQGLESVVFQFVSSLSFTESDTSALRHPLVYSSDQSGVARPPVFIDIQKRWTEADFLAGKQLLAAAIEGVGGGPARLVVVANGGFCVNGAGERPQQLGPDNVSLASNAIDWISDDTGLINLRTKGVTSRPLEEVEDSTRELLKYGNVVLPILLVLIYAFIRRQRNMRKRQKWMQGNFE